MSDDLIYGIFKEIAVIEGKRKPDGTWVDGSPADVQRILARAKGMVERTLKASPKEKKE